MQLQEVFLTLGKHSQGSPHHDIGAVLCQHDINDPAGDSGGEGAAEDGEEPL